jgi:hypothetical protein
MTSLAREQFRCAFELSERIVWKELVAQSDQDCKILIGLKTIKEHLPGVHQARS